MTCAEQIPSKEFAKVFEDFWGAGRMTQSLAEMAVEVLTTADGRAKTALGRAHAARWFAAREAGAPLPVGQATPPPQT